MAYEFLLPDIGEGLAEAEIVKWLVAVGDTVGQDEPLVEVETDKAVVDIPSPVAGTVLRHGAAEGEVCEVGAILAVIGQPDEATQPPPTQPPVEDAEVVESKPSAPPTESRPPLVGTLDEDATELPAASTSASGGDRPQALPLVRRLAREHGVDLASVTGSGPDGRIERDDVLAAAAGTAVAAPAAASDARVRMSKLRRTIADRMVESWSTIPHVTTFDEVDASRLLEARKALSARHGSELPLDALLVAAVIPVLGAFPEFNAVIDGDEVVYRAALNIGVAVDAPDGLMVPVVHDAGSKSVLELSAEVARLATGAVARTRAWPRT